MKAADPRHHVAGLLARAAAFLARHRATPGAHATYAYFTEHPVAPLNRKRLATILGEIQAGARAKGRPLRVLDLACGGGIIGATIAAAGHTLLGLDRDPEEVRLARLFTGEEKLGGTFWVVDVLADREWEVRVDAFLQGQPDVVVLAYALHHLPHVETFVARLARWLASGRVLLINEENPASPLFRLKHVARTWIQRDTDAEWHRSFAGWRRLLASHGFETTPPIGLDLMPGMARILPGRCWSLVFRAERK
ncbi:MAG TPA: class I SAM-dependent methyltransferase [bacterium]